jgi:hypothetical protein
MTCPELPFSHAVIEYLISAPVRLERFGRRLDGDEFNRLKRAIGHWNSVVTLVDKITHWQEGPVDRTEEHFELRYGSARNGAWDE